MSQEVQSKRGDKNEDLLSLRRSARFKQKKKFQTNFEQDLYEGTNVEGGYCFSKETPKKTSKRHISRKEEKNHEMTIRRQFIFSDWLIFDDHRKSLKLEEDEDPGEADITSKVCFVVISKEERKEVERRKEFMQHEKINDQDKYRKSGRKTKKRKHTKRRRNIMNNIKELFFKANEETGIEETLTNKLNNFETEEGYAEFAPNQIQGYRLRKPKRVDLDLIKRVTRDEQGKLKFHFKTDSVHLKIKMDNTTLGKRRSLGRPLVEKDFINKFCFKDEIQTILTEDKLLQIISNRIAMAVEEFKPSMFYRVKK